MMRSGSPDARRAMQSRRRRLLLAAAVLATGCNAAHVADSDHPPPPVDATPPIVTGFGATGTRSPVTISAFTATDDAAVTGFAITESATAPTAGAGVWSGAAPTTYWTSSTGTVTLYPWTKDAAGNVSAPFGSPVTLTLTAPPNRPRLGTNLNWCVDWDPEKLPADLIWSARPWTYMAGGSGNGDNDASWTPLDARGWPVVAANTAFGAIFEGNPWPGTYKLSFKNRSGSTGDTVTSYSGGSNITLTNRQHDPATNVTTYDVNVLGPAADQFIWLIWAGATGGVTDVSLMRPLKDRSGSHAIGTPLADHVVDRLRWFSAIRTMQTQGGGAGKTAGLDKDWADRTSPWGPQTRSRGSPGHRGGVAIENLVAMANQVDQDLWLNVPFYATDDYVTRMAQAIKCGTDGNAPWVNSGTSTCAAGDPTFKPLKPGLKLYVEFANEIWNSGRGYWEGENERAAGTAVCAQGDPYKLNAIVGTQGPNGSPDANCPNQANPGWGWRRTGYLAVRVSILFRAVFGDGEMITRIRPVLATQHARYATTVDPLRYIESVWGPSSPYDTLGNVDFTGTYTNPRQPVGYYLYAVATAPYTFTAQGFGDTSVGGLLSATIADFNDTRRGYIVPAISDNAREASSRGLKLVAYEGGEGLIPELYSGGATATAVTNSILASFDPTQGARMGASIDTTTGLPLADQSTTIYGRLFSEWALRGGDLFMHFTLGEAANGGSMFGLCAPTGNAAITVTGWSADMGASSSDCRFEYGPKWDAVKAFSRAWGP